MFEFNYIKLFHRENGEWLVHLTPFSFDFGNTPDYWHFHFTIFNLEFGVVWPNGNSDD